MSDCRATFRNCSFFLKEIVSLLTLGMCALLSLVIGTRRSSASDTDFLIGGRGLEHDIDQSHQMYGSDCILGSLKKGIKNLPHQKKLSARNLEANKNRAWGTDPSWCSTLLQFWYQFWGPPSNRTKQSPGNIYSAFKTKQNNFETDKVITWSELDWLRQASLS